MTNIHCILSYPLYGLYLASERVLHISASLKEKVTPSSYVASQRKLKAM
tara:strand:+ start:289 stop:435 length:147 start_codon:yes stop_codon:yes gene_type:complete